MSHPTPRDLPGLRADLSQWYTSPEAHALIAEQIQCDLATARGVNLRHKATVDIAGLYYVNADMTALAESIGQGLETFALLDEDLPEDHGLLMWAHRPVSIPGMHGAPLAVTWSMVGGYIDVSLYEHLPTARAESRAVYQHQAQAAGARPGQMPDLMQLWESRMRADGRDRPWAAVEDAEDSSAVLRTLLATWLLIRQPADARKALHQVEDVAAPKSVQKHIRRAGGDPTRTVRYVTLRQSLRRLDDSGDSAASHAGKVYRHRWFVRPHRARQYYPSTGEHQTIWRGPYLVVPLGCEDAPILGGERVNVLRR